MPMYQPIGDDSPDDQPGTLDVAEFEFPPTGLPNAAGSPRDYRCARCGASRFVRRQRSRFGTVTTETFLCPTCDLVERKAPT